MIECRPILGYPIISHWFCVNPTGVPESKWGWGHWLKPPNSHPINNGLTPESMKSMAFALSLLVSTPLLELSVGGSINMNISNSYLQSEHWKDHHMYP